MKHSKHEILTSFQLGEDQASQAARQIRTKLDFEEQSFILDKLPEDAPNTKKFLTGVRFAKNWEEVWQAPCVASISSSQKSIDWFVLMAIRNAKHLSSHAKFRDDLNHAVLHGEWSVAENILEKHQAHFGPTLWGLNWGILLIDESRGAHRKQEHLKQFEGDAFGKIIPVFADLFGLSTDQTLPEETFRKIINSCVSQSGAFKRFLDFLFLEDCSTNFQVTEILDYFEFIPLIDRYELFIRLVAVVLGDNHQDALRMRKATCKIADLCDDTYLRYIAESVDEYRPIESSGESALLISAWDAFMTSNYDESLRIATDIALRKPELLGAHELVVKSIIYLNKKDAIAGTHPIALLWQNLCNVFLKNENSDDSLNYLQKFGRRFRVFPLTYPLRSLHASHSSYFQDSNVCRRGSYAMTSHGPRSFEYGHAVEVNKHYLQRCADAFPSSVTIRFFCALASGVAGKEVKNCDSIPQIRRYFFGGLAAARRHDYTQGLAYLKHFLSLQKADAENPLSPFAIEEARRTLVDIYRLKGDVVNMQREVVKTFLNRPQSIRRLPIQRIYKASTDNREEACGHIEFPIIANLACDEPHDVYLELRRFLNAVGVSKPTELLKMQSFGQQALAILFLRVCTPEVIDSIDVLDSVAKVEAERLQSLRWITKNVPTFARMAETEILRLTQHAQLREALQKIEGARVVVNVAALREAETEHFTDAYFRFAAQRELDVTRTNEELSGLVKAISALSQFGENKLLLIQTDGHILQHKTALKSFASSFLEIRDSFVYSPHFGVEACLSGRIRHGIVIQHIRKPFVEKRLTVAKDSAERTETEKYWQPRIFCYDKTKMGQIMDVLIQLTDQINKIAEEVKGVWLHSKTETKNPDGLFDYSFSAEQLEGILSKRMQDVTSVDIFLDRAFDVLLERTRASLSVVKGRINLNLRSRLRDAVDQAIAKLPELPSHYSLLSLRNDLATCRQETERVCDQMVAWFEQADATLMGDASIELVARTAVGMIEQLNPEVRGRYQIEVDSIQRVRGRHFTSLVHILFFMLDNASHHSNVAKEVFRAKLTIRTTGNDLIINVESKMLSDETADAACRKLRATIAELTKALDPHKVIKEGGSGYAKIMAAVRYGFKQKDPVIEATYDRNHMLKIALTCELGGLAA